MKSALLLLIVQLAPFTTVILPPMLQNAATPYPFNSLVLLTTSWNMDDSAPSSLHVTGTSDADLIPEMISTQ